MEKFNSKEVNARLKKIEESRLREMSQVDKLLYKKKVDEISDLHSIQEDSDDEVFTKKEEVSSNLLESILRVFLLRETSKVAVQVEKVNYFLLMCLHRRRYKKVYKKVSKI